MNIDAIAFLPALREPTLLPSGAAAAPSGQFAAWFGSQVAAVNDQLVQAERGVQELAAGGPVSLHQVMIDLEQAKLSLQLMMQVRTGLLESFQEVLRSPI
jgi:flagellar hook-basal body complex protein FliE